MVALKNLQQLLKFRNVNNRNACGGYFKQIIIQIVSHIVVHIWPQININDHL